MRIPFSLCVHVVYVCFSSFYISFLHGIQNPCFPAKTILNSTCALPQQHPTVRLKTVYIASSLGRQVLFLPFLHREKLIVNKLFTISGQNGVDITALICYHAIVYKNCIGIQSFAKNNLRRSSRTRRLKIRWGSEQITLSFKEVFKQ